MRIDLLNDQTLLVPQNKTLSIGFSGGVESSLLLYLLLKHTNRTLYLFNWSTRVRKHRNATVASNVLEWCSNKTGNHDVVLVNIRKEEIDLSDTENDAIAIQNQYMNSGIVDFIYIGSNKLPPDGHPHTENIKQLFPDEYEKRNPNKNHQTFRYSVKIQFPLLNLDKRDIKDIFIKEGISELYDLTWSCAEYISDEDWEIGKTHCGVCCQCQERIYGFGRV